MGLNVDQELFGAFAFYAAIVLVKMLFMSFLTARQRFGTGTFISSEDIVGQEKKGFKTGVNENVERVRRAHLNDMENILPFFCLGLLYIFTNPALSTAVLVFRLYFANLQDPYLKCSILYTANKIIMSSIFLKFDLNSGPSPMCCVITYHIYM